MQLTLQSPVQYVPRIGPRMAKLLEKLGAITVEDLLYYVPFRYDDFSLILPIARVRPGETVTISGTVISIKNAITKTGKKLQEARVADQTDTMNVIWFNQPFLTRIIHEGDTIRLAGKVDWFGHKVIMSSPVYEITKTEGSRGSLHTGRFVPIYPETEGVTSKWLRGRIAYLLDTVLQQAREHLPIDIQQTNRLVSLREALASVHFPKTLDEGAQAKKRLAFDELFWLCLRSRHQRTLWEQTKHAPPITIPKEDLAAFIQQLPFELTNDQKTVVNEICNDMTRATPMNRLFIGDVGSGKTVVAAIAMYVACRNGLQSVLMAPTQILAEQHYQTITKLLSQLGINAGLVTGIRIKNAGILHSPILIGTHALLSKSTTFKNVGLIVIDEQHRFGVEQRKLLQEKGKGEQTPHLLTMTATPIPRTVARTMFGNLDLSILTQMPTGRTKIKTWLVPKEKRENAYAWIKKQLRETGGQAFIICPLIEESETLATVKAVKSEYERLKGIFSEFSLGLLHGRLKPKEKAGALERFRTQKDAILLATPVVEVGIDIPNAIIMLVEAAERFGLAQLHQLRGRVGRGSIASFCLMFTEAEDEITIKRLKSMETIHNGPQLAEVDLSLRGPGELFGSKQHGIPPLRIASFSDKTLIHDTQKAVDTLMQSDPLLATVPLLSEKLKEDRIQSATAD